MRHNPAPFYLKAQLKSAVQTVQDLAEQKGLTQVFEMDLFSVKRTAEDALATEDREDVGRVLEQLRVLEARLRATPEKNDPLLLR